MRDEALVVRVSEPAREPDIRLAAWSDDVAVDFPSIAVAAERMRDAFLASDARRDAVVADVRVTPREAHAGCRVLVDVSVATTCAACGGRGEIWSDACVICHGSGAESARRRVAVSVPPGVEDGDRLFFNIAWPQARSTLVRLRVLIGLRAS